MKKKKEQSPVKNSVLNKVNNIPIEKLREDTHKKSFFLLVGQPRL